ncbi:MAG: hypothetical protein V3T05_13875 [Myxococcota bacterium]
MSVDEVRRILQQARADDSPGGETMWVNELRQAWAKAVESEEVDGKPISQAEAELFRDLAGSNLSSEARRLLREVVNTRIPELIAPEQPDPSPTGPRVVDLTGVGGKTVGLLSSGALRIENPTEGSDPLVEAGATLVLGQIDTAANPFAALQDVAVLNKVIDMHVRLYEEIKNRLRLTGATPYALSHGRAAMLAVSRLAAERIAQLEGGDAANRLGARLVALAQNEPHAALRKFEVYRLLQSETFKDVPEVKQAESTVFPTDPPYAKWREDGVLRIKAYSDDDGGPWTDQVNIFQRRLGMRVIEGSTGNPDETVVFEKIIRNEGGGFQRMEVILAPRPQENETPSLFENIGDDDIDIIIYSGHAGYGQRVDAALRGGVETSGAGKLIMLFQCWGAGNLDSIGRAFPQAQVFSTIDSSTAWTDDATTVRALQAFSQGKNWQQIIDQLSYRPKKPDTSGWNKLYFTPGTRQIIEQYVDFDQDGQNVKDDRVYLEPTRDLLTRAATGFNPVNHGVPAYTLDASGSQTAVDDANLILRYNKFGIQATPPGSTEPLTLEPGLIINAGFFNPEPGDNRAFSIEAVTVDGQQRLRVRQNAAFGHTQPEELKNFLAFELGKQIAAWSGKSEQESVAFGMAFYLQSIYHHKSQWESYTLFDDEALEHRLFLARYGLPEMKLEDFMHMLQGDHPSFGSGNMGEFVSRMTEWTGDRTGAPTVIGKPITLTNRDSLYEGPSWSRQIARDKLQTLVRTFDGLSDATVLSWSPRDYWTEGPRTVQVTDGTGKRHVIILEIARDTGKPTSAYNLGTSVDLQHAALESISLQRDEWSKSIWGEQNRNRETLAREVLGAVEAMIAEGTTPKAIAEAIVEIIERSGGQKDEVSSIFGSYNGGMLKDVFSREQVAELDEYLDTLWG